MHCRIRTVGTVQPRSHCDRWGARARLVCSDAGWLHTMPPAETHDLQAVTVCSEAVRSPGRRRRSAGVVQPVAVGHYLPLSRVTSAAGQGRLLSLTTVKFLRPRGREADTRSAPTPGVRLGAEFYGLTERVVAGTSATVSLPGDVTFVATETQYRSRFRAASSSSRLASSSYLRAIRCSDSAKYGWVAARLLA